MSYRILRKYVPKKVKIGISGRYFPVYASAEWNSAPRKRGTRRPLTSRRRRLRL